MKKGIIILIFIGMIGHLNAKETETIVLGGGCFWCTEAVYSRLKGVVDVQPGYSGGKTTNPTYQEVCKGTTGHAEVIQIEFDPIQISVEAILQVFMKTHDPTTLNRQGADVGTQYRSVIFYSTEQQKLIANKVVSAYNSDHSKPAVTEIVKLNQFYSAEKDHWKYYDQNKNQPYCRFVIEPKIDKLNKDFKGLLKE